MLLKQFMSKKTSIETICVLERLIGFCKTWDKKIDEDIVWPDRKKLITNYENLLTIDVNEYRVITMQLTKEHFDD